MSKQKIVIKFANDKKSRSKAMKTAVRISGVESVSLKEGQIEVTGVGVDAAELINSLRESFGETFCCVLKKKDGFAEIVSVTPVKKEDTKDNNKDKEKDNLSKNLLDKGFQFGYHPSYHPMYVAADHHPDPSCSIL